MRVHTEVVMGGIYASTYALKNYYPLAADLSII